MSLYVLTMNICIFLCQVSVNSDSLCVCSDLALQIVLFIFFILNLYLNVRVGFLTLPLQHQQHVHQNVFFLQKSRTSRSYRQTSNVGIFSPVEYLVGEWKNTALLCFLGESMWQIQDIRQEVEYVSVQLMTLSWSGLLPIQAESQLHRISTSKTCPPHVFISSMWMLEIPDNLLHAPIIFRYRTGHIPSLRIYFIFLKHIKSNENISRPPWRA